MKDSLQIYISTRREKKPPLAGMSENYIKNEYVSNSSNKVIFQKLDYPVSTSGKNL